MTWRKELWSFLTHPSSKINLCHNVFDNIKLWIRFQLTWSTWMTWRDELWSSSPTSQVKKPSLWRSWWTIATLAVKFLTTSISSWSSWPYSSFYEVEPTIIFCRLKILTVCLHLRKRSVFACQVPASTTELMTTLPNQRLKQMFGIWVRKAADFTCMTMIWYKFSSSNMAWQQFKCQEFVQSKKCVLNRWCNHWMKS